MNQDKPMNQDGKKKRGPPREKESLTLRLDNEILERVRALCESTDMRITDMVERGLVLVLKEYDQELPFVSSKVRHLVNNATRAEQLVIRRFLAFLRWPACPADVPARSFILGYLKTLEQHSAFSDALALYHSNRKEITND